jgi:ABC-type antimicrobial peptide transport system permease subunit
MVLREVLLLAAIGIGIGLPAAWWLAQYVRSQIYGVQPRDPMAFAFAILSLLSVAVLAGALPALKASRVDPVRVLRHE